MSNVIHLFHGPQNIERQKSFLNILALPIDMTGYLKYPIEYVNSFLYSNIEDINKKGNYEGIFWVLNRKNIKDGSDEEDFDFAIPIREIKNIRINKLDQQHIEIQFVVGSYIDDSNSNYNKTELAKVMNVTFNDSDKPVPNGKNSLAYLCNSNVKINTNDDINLNNLKEKLSCMTRTSLYKNEPLISDYPLIIIKEITNSKIITNNLKNFIHLYSNDNYILKFIFLQNNINSRNFRINNGNSFVEEFDKAEIDLNRLIDLKIKVPQKTEKLILVINPYYPDIYPDNPNKLEYQINLDIIITRNMLVNNLKKNWTSYLIMLFAAIFPTLMIWHFNPFTDATGAVKWDVVALFLGPVYAVCLERFLHLWKEE